MGLLCDCLENGRSRSAKMNARLPRSISSESVEEGFRSEQSSV